MAQQDESFNTDLYDLLKVRGYHPVPLNSKNQRVGASQQADVMEFTFKKDGEEYGKVWASIDDASRVIIYYDDEQADSPSDSTPGLDYDDSWTGFLKHVKNWAQRRQLDFELSNKDRLGDDMRQRDYYKMKERLGESYHPMGKKSSYNDAVPNVKIILQHNRALEEGEQRYRNVARIFLENQDGERFLAPTTRPGIARVYARHIAEGGLPNDERWNHIKTVVEDYNKMGGFVRATRNGQFNESAQELVQEGINHYNNLRETLHKLTGHRGYQAYFESWTPTLMEDELDESINELFVQEMVDPRIESAMPILSKLKKPVTEMEEVDSLAEWADNVISEKLELDELSPAKKWDYTDKGRASLDSIMSKVADAEDSDTAKKLADKAVKRQSTIDKTEKSLAHGTMHEKMDSTTKSLAVPADKMLEAPGAETLAHNQSTEKSNLKAFDLAEEAQPPAELVAKYVKKYGEKEGKRIASEVYAAAKAQPKKKVKQQSTDQSDEPAKSKLQHFEKKARSKIFRKPKEIDEDLGPEQKRVGQLGPTEKVKNNNIGKLVGASESVEHQTDELEDITKLAGI